MNNKLCKDCDLHTIEKGVCTIWGSGELTQEEPKEIKIEATKSKRTTAMVKENV